MGNITGDLNQIAEQVDFLSRRGIQITNSNTLYPRVVEQDWKEALSLLWAYSTPGWWHYETDFVKLGLKTKEEFKEKLMSE